MAERTWESGGAATLVPEPGVGSGLPSGLPLPAAVERRQAGTGVGVGGVSSPWFDTVEGLDGAAAARDARAEGSGGGRRAARGAPADPPRAGGLAAPGVAASGVAAPGVAASGLEGGARLGPFELVRRLGEGATGAVWEAVDRRIDAPVALKIFAPVRGAAPLARVMAEARASSRVVSDHVVYVREAGEIDGTSYIAMALCREETATDAAPRVARALTEEAPTSLAEAVAWGEQIARGVAAAHAAGVFHRDLKPDNVLVLPASRAVRIADFGLSPLRGAAHGAADGPLLAAPDADGPVVAGTPAYMAPEQARGFRRAPDPARDAEALAAIDVFGVGVTLWAALAGRAPHAAETVEAMRARAAGHPVPDLRAVATRFRVPARLARIVARATAFDPADRYPSAAALAVDLARYRASHPISLDASWAPVRLALWARRNPARLAAAAWLLAVGTGLAATREVYAGLEDARGELARLEAARDAAAAEARLEAEHAAAEERRADAAADAAYTSAQRAESAEEHAAHLRRYAAQAVARAETAVAASEAARASEAEARVAEAEARSAEGAARASEAEARSAEGAARASEAEARSAEGAARASEAEARASEAEARASEAEARASEAEARAVARASAVAAERARVEAASARAEAASARASEVEALEAARASAAASARAEARASEAEARARAEEAGRRAAERRAEAAAARLGEGGAATGDAARPAAAGESEPVVDAE